MLSRVNYPAWSTLHGRENFRLDNVHTFASFAEQDGSFLKDLTRTFSVHIRCDMFHEEEREVPSAAIIYILYMKEEKESVSRGQKEKF
jgi:hypothetical protein